MTADDPLRVLHADDPPVQPDPAFAAALRGRLQAALSLPYGSEEIVMSGTAAAIAELDQQQPAAEQPRPAALPYLTVGDARAAIAWYGDAFGAELLGSPIVMEDGRIGHAELAIAGGVLYLADEFPDLGLRAPIPGATSVSLMLAVTDTDVALARAGSRGADIERKPYEAHGSRSATIRDPFGHRWMLTGPVRGSIRPGDIGYVEVRTPDPARAAAFYTHVLGWSCGPDGAVTNTVERIGLSVDPRTTMFCCYAVDDLVAAQEAISAAGGRVGAARRFPIGDGIEATDAAGSPFGVYLPDADQPRPLLNGTEPGELSYVTHQVPESAPFREFYSRVFGWTFAPGHVTDGWEVHGTQPMAGVAGGSAHPVTVAMWTVADVDAAVRRVREAGGTVIAEPSRQSYGVTAECADDQGGRFYLGTNH